jgi:hypothetical protein
MINLYKRLGIFSLLGYVFTGRCVYFNRSSDTLGGAVDVNPSNGNLHAAIAESSATIQVSGVFPH